MLKFNFAWICFITTIYVGLINTQDDTDTPIDDVDPLAMNNQEKDKLLACTELVAYKLKKDAKVIEDLANMVRGKVSDEALSNKVTGDLINKCYYSIDESTVSTIFYKGQFMEPNFNDEDFQSFTAIDYSTYKSLTPMEFNLTPETQLIFMKIEKARTEYMSTTKQRMEKSRGEFRIFGYSLKDIPVGINVILLIVILSFFMGGLMIMLKMVMSNDKKTAGRKLEKNQKNK